MKTVVTLLRPLPLTLSQYRYFNETLTIENRTTTTLICGLTSDTKIEYPWWNGPSKERGFTTFSYQGDPTFNPNVGILTRVACAVNKNDLVLSPAKWIDEGRFQCSFAGVGSWFIRLNVRGNLFSFQIQMWKSYAHAIVCIQLTYYCLIYLTLH